MKTASQNTYWLPDGRVSRRAVGASPWWAAGLGLGLLLLAGCPTPGPRYEFDPHRYDNLPDDPVALIKLADRLVAPNNRSLKHVDRSLAALDRAEHTGPPDLFAVRWRQARSAFFMAEGLTNRDQRLGFARTGVEHARQAVTLAPGRVEGHYYLALTLAKVAEASHKLKLIKPMIQRMERARAVDPTYDHAGPDRFLGKVYLTAPAWPVSVGDPDKAVEYLEKAVALSPYAVNRIFLGQAYLADEEDADAVTHLERGLAEGRAQGVDPRWIREGEAALRKLCVQRHTEGCHGAPGTLAADAGGTGAPSTTARGGE